MSADLIKRDEADKIERVLIGGDLAQLKPEERVSYYRMVCESVGLNPLTKPFEYITLNGKLTLYARKDCTDQLRTINQISVEVVAREVVDECFVVTTLAKTSTGRTDGSIGAVSIANLKGEAKCNAMMKAETKAKRRVTLSICGLGLLDETEIESIPARNLKEVPRTIEPEEIGGAAKVATVSTQEGTVPTDAAPDVPVIGADCIGKGEAVNFAREFNAALPKKYAKDADDIRHAWLAAEGIKDAIGKPSAYAIKKESFYDVRDAGVAFAKAYQG